METITFIFSAISLVGAVTVVYQIFWITVIDADSRGLKHPKFWGFFTMNGNNSGGLILYLIGRRKYPIKFLSETARAEMQRRKKAAGIGLIFLAVGGIGLMLSSIVF